MRLKWNVNHKILFNSISFLTFQPNVFHSTTSRHPVAQRSLSRHCDSLKVHRNLLFFLHQSTTSAYSLEFQITVSRGTEGRMLLSYCCYGLRGLATESRSICICLKCGREAASTKDLHGDAIIYHGKGSESQERRVRVVKHLGRFLKSLQEWGGKILQGESPKSPRNYRPPDVM